mgnify:CR=1 FL=1
MKKYLVIGNPIEHSLSPKLHSYWIKNNDIDAIYEKEKLDENDLENLILKVKDKIIHGINITVPFKKAVIPYMDKLTTESENTQSVNTIYLKDNVLGFVHNLTESPYSFAAEAGVINDRFEIVFKAQALSADTFDLDTNTVQIIQLDDTHVTFKASGNLNIKTVTIYDLLGRQLYQLEGSHNEETYNLSSLQHSVFIAKVALSNGALITKKAIKK